MIILFPRAALNKSAKFSLYFLSCNMDTLLLRHKNMKSIRNLELGFTILFDFQFSMPIFTKHEKKLSQRMEIPEPVAGYLFGMKNGC